MTQHTKNLWKTFKNFITWFLIFYYSISLIILYYNTDGIHHLEWIKSWLFLGFWIWILYNDCKPKKLKKITITTCKIEI